MYSLAYLRQMVQDYIEDETDVNLVNRAINRSIMKVMKSGIFDQMLGKHNSTPDSSGVVYAPPRCLRILAVYPSNSGINSTEYIFSGTRSVQGSTRALGYKYRSAGITEEPLKIITARYSTGSNSVEEASGSEPFSESDIGEELIINGGSEKYQILDFDDTQSVPTYTIYPQYKYAAGTFTSHVRREGTEMISIFDHNGNPYTGEVTIEYLKYHPVLVNNEDMLLIPTPDTVFLDSVIFMLRQTKYDVDAQRLREDYNEAKRNEFSNQISIETGGVESLDPMFRIHSKCRRSSFSRGNNW